MSLRPLLVMALVAAAACGSEDAPDEVAELGWTLNYRDWTKDLCTSPNVPVGCTDADLRGCNNVPTPPPGSGVPAYPGIARVHVELVDPNGQVPGYDRDLACSDGMGDRISIRGLVKQTFELTLSAEATDGTVLYQRREDLDLTTPKSGTLELRTVVGELHFFPNFAGSGQSCPAGVTTLRWTVFENNTTTEVLSDTLEACDAGLVNEVFIRGIPSEPEPNSIGGYVPIAYDVQVEALDAGAAVVFCGRSDRNVFPGDNNFTDNLNLASGSCPAL